MGESLRFAAIGLSSWVFFAMPSLAQTVPSITYFDDFTRCLKGEFSSAIKSCDRLLQTNPNDAAVWVNRGQQLARQGSYTEALNSYDRALTLQPNYSLAWVNRCADLISTEQYDLAIAACETAIASDQDWGNQNPAIAYYNLGVVYEQQLNHQTAQQMYAQAVAIDANFAPAWNGLGMVSQRLGEFPAAAEAYQQAVNLSQNSQYQENLLNLQRLGY